MRQPWSMDWCKATSGENVPRVRLGLGAVSQVVQHLLDLSVQG